MPLPSIPVATLLLSTAAAVAFAASSDPSWSSLSYDDAAISPLSRSAATASYPEFASVLRDDDTPTTSAYGDRDDREEDSRLDQRLFPSPFHGAADGNIDVDAEVFLTAPRFGRPTYHSGWRDPLDEDAVAPLSFSRSSLTTRAGVSTSLPSTSNLPRHRLRSTGTTVAGCLAANGTVVVLGADTRATDGTTVADNRCRKLHRLAANVWCAGAGTSADVDALTRRAEYVFRWRGKRDGEMIGNAETTTTTRAGTDEEEDGPLPPPPAASVIAVLRYLRGALIRSRGSLGVNLVLGGYDAVLGRANLVSIHPHGSIDATPIAALGSGGLAATAVLESGYRGPERTSVEEAVDLVVRAIKAGIDNDLGSGSQVDIVVISREGAVFRRGVVEEERLPPSEVKFDEEDVAVGAREEKQGEQASVFGVAGFGNVPFAIKSKRVIVRGNLEVERERSEWLEKVLSD